MKAIAFTKFFLLGKRVHGEEDGDETATVGGIFNDQIATVSGDDFFADGETDA